MTYHNQYRENYRRSTKQIIMETSKEREDRLNKMKEYKNENKYKLRVKRIENYRRNRERILLYERANRKMDWLSLRQSHWNVKENAKIFLCSLRDQFYVERPEDWYRISSNQIKGTEEGRKFMRHFKNLFHAVSFAFPDFPWVRKKFSFKGKKAKQRWLFFLVCKTFRKDHSVQEGHVISVH
eukprot:TRINITY_DN1022_c0_g1_i5.p1 TRINITY_DN1022_c0_g1~~TRINITY_DN1022_c0_g1_i5.p1  ORF type:complete len:182 (+),score=27.59 TRINITY_DN1022_c0_g1_i5:145-690(+)